MVDPYWGWVPASGSRLCPCMKRLKPRAWLWDHFGTTKASGHCRRATSAGNGSGPDAGKASLKALVQQPTGEHIGYGDAGDASMTQAKLTIGELEAGYPMYCKALRRLLQLGKTAKDYSKMISMTPWLETYAAALVTNLLSMPH